MSAEKAQDGNVGDCSPEKGSRNKRKFVSDPPPDDPNKSVDSSENDSPGYELPIQDQRDLCRACGCSKDNPDAFRRDLKLLFPVEPSDLESVEQESLGLHWSDLTEGHLEELCMGNLDSMFKSAIKMIAATGYGECVATKSVLRTGICDGYKDTLTNVVENALDFLENGREFDPARDHFFDELEQLEKYTLAEMVCALKEVDPLLSTGDAMWCLLICDMNVPLACTLDLDSSGCSGSNEAAGVNSSVSVIPESNSKANSSGGNQLTVVDSNSSAVNTSSCQHDLIPVKGIPSLPNPKSSAACEAKPAERVSTTTTSNKIKKSLGAIDERVQAVSQCSISTEKPVGCKKGHSSGGKKDTILRQKIQLEKTYRGALRAGKLSGLILDKKFRAVSESIGVRPKNASMKIHKAMEVNIQAHGNSHVSLTVGTSNPSAPIPIPSVSNKKTVNTPSAPPKANAEPSPSQPVPSKTSTASNITTSSLVVPDFSHYGIPFDKTTGMWVPQDKHDQVILQLATKALELQNQLGNWTEWANQKVLQATRRLIKDKGELKALKQEKEEVEKIKKERKSLEENTIRKRSEMENALCKANEQVKQADAEAHKLGEENSRLRKEIKEAKKQSAAELANVNEMSKREKKTAKELQASEWEKTSLQEELVALNRKRVQLEQELEQEENTLKQLQARENQAKKEKEELLVLVETRRKEREHIETSLRSEENKMVLEARNDALRYEYEIRELENQIAQLRLKTDSSKFAQLRWGTEGSRSYLTDSGRAQDNLQTKSVKRERECVMCLTEEMSVVFLPCAHQVLCTKCNELHESQGMKECPSCRTPIERRICARFCS